MCYDDVMCCDVMCCDVICCVQVVREEVDDGTGGGITSLQANALTAEDQDRRLAAAESKQSGRRREVFLADMGRQSKQEQGRGRGPGPGGESEGAPDVQYEVVEGVQGHEARRDRGVLDWDKQQVTSLHIITSCHHITIPHHTTSHHITPHHHHHHHTT
jgi:hypothetical protein